jgi:hypothetical protein
MLAVRLAFRPVKETAYSSLLMFVPFLAQRILCEITVFARARRKKRFGILFQPSSGEK